MTVDASPEPNIVVEEVARGDGHRVGRGGGPGPVRSDDLGWDVPAVVELPDGELGTVGVDGPVGGAAGLGEELLLAAEIEEPGGRGEHLDGEQRRGRQIDLGELGSPADQDVGLENARRAERDVEGSE